MEEGSLSRFNAIAYIFNVKRITMNQAQFTQLIEGFCKECGLDEPERILHGGPVAVGEVVFSLIYSEQVNPELMFVYCDFGEAPHDKEAEVYRILLEANMFLYTGSGPAFTISSETGRVVLAEHHRLDQLEPKGLREILIKMAGHATAWRTDYFLDTPKKQASQANGAAKRSSTQALFRS
jgi:hypothetical protein